MRITLRRLPNGETAFQRIVLRADDARGDAKISTAVHKAKTPPPERSFIEALLGEKGRAIVARINPRFRQPRLQVIKVQGGDH